MLERVGLHAAPCVALQCIIPDLGRRIHGLCDVASLKTVEPFLCVTRPDARQTIRLQFKTHRNGVAFTFADLLADAIGLTKNTQFVLDMMRDLMGDDVSCCEIPARPKLAFKRHKKNPCQGMLCYRQDSKTDQMRPMPHRRAIVLCL